MLCHWGRNEHEALWHNYEAEEVRHIISKRECNDLAQQLAQLLREIDEFHQTLVFLLPRTRSLGAIMQEAQPLTWSKTHPLPTFLLSPSNHMGRSHRTETILPIPLVPTSFPPPLFITLPPPPPSP